CAQLPDLSRELDAKSLRLEMGIWSPRWTFFNACSDAQVAHMAISQFYVHTLTGGTGERALKAAEKTLDALKQQADQSNEARCAVGFALHALGDARAHQVLGSNPAAMYPTGEGHLTDGTKPDHPLFPGRDALWTDYATWMGTNSSAPNEALTADRIR